MKKVLFVCLGNICRSPMAEAVLRHQLKKNGLSDDVIVDSAGIGGWHAGQAPHKGTQKILKQHGISFADMKARQVKIEDFSEYDMILGMDQENVADLLQQAPAEFQHKISLFLDLLPGKKGKNVPDPWFTGNFVETFQLINKGTPHLIEALVPIED